MRPYLILLFVLCLLVGCGAKPTSTATPTEAPHASTTEEARMKAAAMTATAASAQTAAALTAEHTPTHTATATATETPSPTPTFTPTPVPPSKLQGQVWDERSGQPVEGAQITAGQWFTSTDSDGRFVFSDLPSGQYTVLVTAADHDPVLSGIVEVTAGEQTVVDTALPAAGAGEYPEDPMATNQIDPAGAPTAEDAERLARQQGLTGEVASIKPVTLRGAYLVNYRKENAIRSALARLHHPAWELVDGTGKAWYIVRVCGNLALARAADVEVPPEVEAQPHPVVTVGHEAVDGYACAWEGCEVVAQLPSGWHGIALACSEKCEWLQIQVPGAAGGCWVRRDQVSVLGNPEKLVQIPSGKIAFFSDRDSPGYGEIYLMNPDGSEQTRLTSNLQISQSQLGGPPGVLNLRWSPVTGKFFFSTKTNGQLYAVNADGSGSTMLAERVFGFDVSPDGQRIVASRLNRTTLRPVIVTMNADGTGRAGLTDDAIRADLGLEPDSGLHGPAWSPDGAWIAFYSHSPESVFTIHPDGSAPVAHGLGGQIIAGSHMDWSPDSRNLIFHQEAPPGLGILDMTTGLMTDVFQAEWLWHPGWSPDGNRIIFDWYVEGEGTVLDSQIWVVNVDGTSLTRLTSEGKNCCPVWLP